MAEFHSIVPIPSVPDTDTAKYDGFGPDVRLRDRDVMV